MLARKKRMLRRLRWLLLLITVVLVFNEFLIYFVVLLQCDWPATQTHSSALKTLILADPHLLGRRQGHWFDRLRREWQMYRSFSTALQIFTPDVVFIVGDLFDEGLWADQAELDSYYRRYESVFNAGKVPIYVALGNHDVGFHYAIQPSRLEWFHRQFHTDDVTLLHLKGTNFVFINSMAMENDGCRLCHFALEKLKRINHTLTCAKNGYKMDSCRDEVDKFPYSRPIIMQHFPMFRRSDVDCSEPDEALPEEKLVPFRGLWDCLSEESSQLILDLLDPNLIVDGHSHNGCATKHRRSDGREVLELTVSSFSWRNRNNPAFLLATFSNGDYQVAKCLLPHESTVVRLYCLSAVLLVTVAMAQVCKFCWFDSGKLKGK